MLLPRPDEDTNNFSKSCLKGWPLKDNRVSIAIRVKYRAFADDGSIGPETMGPRGREQSVKKKKTKAEEKLSEY